MTTHPHAPAKPGATLTAAGLGLALLGLVLFIIGINGAIALPALGMLLAGLVLAGIGFAQRVLHAVERDRQ